MQPSPGPAVEVPGVDSSSSSAAAAAAGRQWSCLGGLEYDDTQDGSSDGSSAARQQQQGQDPGVAVRFKSSPAGL